MLSMNKREVNSFKFGFYAMSFQVRMKLTWLDLTELH